MPAKTSKNKSSKNKSSKNNSTRKNESPRNILAKDPMLKVMMNGKLKWGDIIHDENMRKPKSNSSSIHSWDSWTSRKLPTSNEKRIMKEELMLEDWDTPDLALRKGIWENFPVILDNLPPRDGTERYAIKWHEKHLKEQREKVPQLWVEWHEYQAFTEFRLFHALRKYSHKYRILPAEAPGQILILEMVHAEGAPRAAHPVGVPILRKLNDIKEHFPVVWHAVQGRDGKSTYALELFGKKIKEISATVGHDVTGEVKSQLTRALEASRAWTVLPAVGKEFCRLEIA